MNICSCGEYGWGRKIVPIEIDNLATMLKNHMNEGKDEAKRKEIKVKETISVKDVLLMMLKNQKKLAEKQLKLAESQHYLTRLLYYSLEVMRRVRNTINNKREESSEIKHSIGIECKIIEYLKSKVN